MKIEITDISIGDEDLEIVINIRKKNSDGQVVVENHTNQNNDFLSKCVDNSKNSIPKNFTNKDVPEHEKPSIAFDMNEEL